MPSVRRTEQPGNITAIVATAKTLAVFDTLDHVNAVRSRARAAIASGRRANEIALDDEQSVEWVFAYLTREVPFGLGLTAAAAREDACEAIAAALRSVGRGDRVGEGSRRDAYNAVLHAFGLPVQSPRALRRLHERRRSQLTRELERLTDGAVDKIFANAPPPVAPPPTAPDDECRCGHRRREHNDRGTCVSDSDCVCRRFHATEAR